MIGAPYLALKKNLLDSSGLITSRYHWKITIYPGNVVNPIITGWWFGT
jgi:hypothetical protein